MASIKVCVAGLWHLGSVTAACLAEKGFEVTGWDPDTAALKLLRQGKAPIYEPALDELLAEGLHSGRLSFSAEASVALKNCRYLWICFDTPVDAKDRADVAWVKEQATALFKHLAPSTAVIVSSQLPVGTSAEFEAALATRFKKDRIPLCCSPENLRLGRAVGIFQNPDRIVAGIRQASDQTVFAPLFSALSERIEWMKTESAEMTKHAINSYLAASVVFANELAVICESVGADAREVERGLKTESRIGPKAYLKPGAAFAGGTLARDVQSLLLLSQRHKLPSRLLHSVLESNEQHKEWTKIKLKDNLKTLRKKSVAVLGLTYKMGTDTLRRSWAVELCRWLHGQGAQVQAYDPQLKGLPAELRSLVSLKSQMAEAIAGCDALVICADHPEIRKIERKHIEQLRRPLIIDPNACLEGTVIESLRSVHYFAVGYTVNRT